MSRVFWDTNLFIYLLEGAREQSERVAHIRERMLERGDQLCTSALTLGEVLVKPYEAGAEDLAREFETAIVNSAVVVPFDTEAARLFARIRARNDVRAPDAIQLACASQARTDLFITNDERLSRVQVPGIQFITSLARAPY